MIFVWQKEATKLFLTYSICQFHYKCYFLLLFFFLPFQSSVIATSGLGGSV